jgi:beta-lactamase regulating signal transducer with metallopeptidase domain
MDATSTAAILTTFTSDLTTILVANVPLVLGILSGLIGLGFVVARVRKYVAKKF